MGKYRNNTWLIKHGLSGSKLYKVWVSIKFRCTNPKHRDFHRYGGRGIRYCPEWEKFIPFMEWALANGYQEGLEIDRIDNDGNYEPSNCRWITRQKNSLNRDKRKDYGIYKNGKNGWAIHIVRNRKDNYGGTYPSVEQAIVKRDELVKMLDAKIA